VLRTLANYRIRHSMLMTGMESVELAFILDALLGYAQKKEAGFAKPASH
jgi:hypothetical protein